MRRIDGNVVTVHAEVGSGLNALIGSFVQQVTGGKK
jgi:hypothetical protein